MPSFGEARSREASNPYASAWENNNERRTTESAKPFGEQSNPFSVEQERYPWETNDEQPNPFSTEQDRVVFETDNDVIDHEEPVSDEETPQEEPVLNPVFTQEETSTEDEIAIDDAIGQLNNFPFGGGQGLENTDTVIKPIETTATEIQGTENAEEEKSEEKKQWTDEELAGLVSDVFSFEKLATSFYDDNDIKDGLRSKGIDDATIDGFLEHLDNVREKLGDRSVEEIYKTIGFDKNEIFRMNDSDIVALLTGFIFSPKCNQKSIDAFMEDVRANREKLGIMPSTEASQEQTGSPETPSFEGFEQNSSLNPENIIDPNSLTPEELLEATVKKGQIDLDSFLNYDDKRMRETILGQFADVKPENVDAAIASIRAEQEKQNNASNPDADQEGVNPEADSKNPDANNEKEKKTFEKGETKPYGDFADWLEKEYQITFKEFETIDKEKRKEILAAYRNQLNGGKAAENNNGVAPAEKKSDDGNDGGNNGGGENPNGTKEADNKTSESGNEDGDGEKSGVEDEDAKNEKALAFVSLATEEEAKMAARDIADQMFAENVARSRNPFKRIILGNMLKEGVLAHYRKQALDAIVAYNADNNDSNKKYNNKTIAQYWSKKGGIERFTLAYMEQVLPAIHSKAGESMQGYTTRTNEKGEIYVVTKSLDKEGNLVEKPVDPNENPGAKAAIDIRKAIEGYAGGKFTLDSLKEEVRRIQQGQGISDEKLNLSIDNLVELAEAAKNRAQHAEGIINVMEGFSYINGDAMRSVRTEVRKTNIEKASEFISTHTMGLISPEVIGGAASLALFFADKSTRTVARAIAPGVGGAIVAGAAAGIRERGRVAEDIATSSREAAMGRYVMGPNNREGNYDKQVAETLYNMQSAETLTDSLNKALEKNDVDAMQKALGNINQLINLSDSKRIDLIRYSDSTNVEDERMNLDIARAKVQVALNKAGIDLAKAETYTNAMVDAANEVGKDVSAKDRARCSLKRKRALGQGAKTAAVSILAGTAIREVSAYFNPNQIGLLDRAFNKENNYNATSTPLASFLGLKEEGVFTPGETVVETVTKYEGAELTSSQLEKLNEQGYIVEPRTVIEGSTSTTQVSVAEYAENHSNGGFVRNWLNNDTSESNGNELRGYYTSEHGWHTGMHGESTGGGVSRNFEDDMAAGKVHAFFSFSRGSQSSPIELSERVFTAADGSQQMEFYSENPEIQSLLDQKLGLVEIASDSGRFTEDGTPIMDIWATWPGEDVEGTITDTVDNTVKKTVYDVFMNETTRMAGTTTEGSDRLINGIAIFPFTSRRALHRAAIMDGKAKQGPNQAAPAPAAAKSESKAPEAAPAPAAEGTTSAAPKPEATQTSESQPENTGSPFTPEDGGEWTVDNLKDLPTDEASVVARMDSMGGYSWLQNREDDARRRMAINNAIKSTIDFNNNTTMSSEQKAALLNGHNPVELGLPQLSSNDQILVWTLQGFGILPLAK